MNLNAGWTELNGALKTLRLSWEEVRSYWSDAVRQDFEAHFWAPLEAQVRAALGGLERAQPVLHKLRDDCG